jgi:5'-3' exoribonuclease 1
MAKLQTQLEYFIRKKISEDSSWRSVKVILSGHDVPGEGEHKIMDYIRHARAQRSYNPNTRHWYLLFYISLYGLDADLIMLGLLSHEPHFCLLREELTFGKKTNSSQTFYLLHFSLLREYLMYEFNVLENNLSFPFDFERILDDYILLTYFVGNDFLPHLPGLHINEGGLALLFNIYKSKLPEFDGYISDNGVLNLARCQVIFEELAILEKAEYEEFMGNSSWMASKSTLKKQNSRKKSKGFEFLIRFDRFPAYIL